MEDDMSILKALKQRLQNSRDGDIKRKRIARIMNEHFKINDYGHYLFKKVNIVTDDKPKIGEEDGKS
jgi:hypothetical protein